MDNTSFPRLALPEHTTPGCGKSERRTGYGYTCTHHADGHHLASLTDGTVAASWPLKGSSPRAAHLLAIKDGGTSVHLEIFSQEDIGSRLAAGRARAFRRLGYEVTRHDFLVGSANDPVVLREAVDLVVRDQRQSWPDYNRYQCVRGAREYLVLRAKDWAPGATVLNGDPTNPTFRAYKTVLTATREALSFVDAIPPADRADEIRWPDEDQAAALTA